MTLNLRSRFFRTVVWTATSIVGGSFFASLALAAESTADAPSVSVEATPAPAASTAQVPSTTTSAPTATTPTSPPLVPDVAPQPTSFSYYCDKAKAYYPNVMDCPEGWVAIPVSAPPPVPSAAQQPMPYPLPPQPRPDWSPWDYRFDRSVVQNHPNAVTLELFGRAQYYSVNFDHALSTRWSLGAGISYWNQTYYWAGLSTNVTVVPVYANYYFSDRPDRGYVTFGAEYIQNTQPGFNNNIYMNDGVAGVAGLGYEFMYDGGFLVRLSAYLIGDSVGVTFNPGFSIGFAF